MPRWPTYNAIKYAKGVIVLNPYYALPYPYYYMGRSEMDTEQMQQMQQMMMEHVEMTRQIKQKVDRMEEQLHRMEKHMNMKTQ